MRNGASSISGILRKSGYRATGPRIAILGAIKESRVPMSIRQIAETLPSDAADQATIYRNVKSLEEKGVIRQVDLRHNHAHYELTDARKHHHLVCVRCGRVEEVRHCNVSRIEEAVLRDSRHFSEIRQHALEFYGACKACSKRAASAAARKAD